MCVLQPKELSKASLIFRSEGGKGAVSVKDGRLERSEFMLNGKEQCVVVIKFFLYVTSYAFKHIFETHGQKLSCMMGSCIFPNAAS